MTELEEIVEGWEYWCPVETCRNRTFRTVTETQSRLFVSEDDKGLQKYLSVRVLVCQRCSYPLVLGTYSYRNNEKDWGAMGEVLTRADAKMLEATMWHTGSVPMKPIEYLAFQEPARERPLPKQLPKKIQISFRESEYALDKGKPIAAAAAIRNTIRLIVENHGIDKDNLKEAIKLLPFEEEFIAALSNLKIMGDDTLHYEEYKIGELRPAVDILELALKAYYARQEWMADIHKAVSDKASKRGRK